MSYIYVHAYIHIYVYIWKLVIDGIVSTNEYFNSVLCGKTRGGMDRLHTMIREAPMPPTMAGSLQSCPHMRGYRVKQAPFMKLLTCL